MGWEAIPAVRDGQLHEIKSPIILRPGPAALNDGVAEFARIVLGLLILLHGIAKLRHGLGPIEEMVAAHGMPSFVAYGVLVGEVVAPLMLLLGLYARIGALLIAINMLFALALVHMGQLVQLND